MNKTITVALIGLLLSSAVLADEAPAPAQAPAKTFILTVTEADLQALGGAIGELPTKIGAPLLAKLQQQIQAQTVAEMKAKAKDTAK